MKKFKGTFERYEKKYLINQHQYTQLMARISDLIIPDRYGKSTICNIYFDTPDYELIRRSIEKPVYKEKLRLRSYGIPQNDSTVYIELKKKYKGIVYKRRTDMKLSDAMGYLYEHHQPCKSNQIINEIDWTINYYHELSPKMLISYDRAAYFYKDDPDLRITFDSNINWREDDLILSDGVSGQALLQDGQYIMEIKIPGVIPLWLANALTELNIYPTSFSKYGTAYKSKISNHITSTNNKNNKGVIYHA